jgi:hypothetical protein
MALLRPVAKRRASKNCNHLREERCSFMKILHFSYSLASRRLA